MSRYCSSKNLEIVTGFKGIGTYSAVGLLFIIGDPHRFASSKKGSSYIGVHPALQDSGDGSKVVRMSKKGNKEARVILFNVAMSAIVHNETDADTDKAKQELDKNRRYQTHDQNAPVSRRQAQKRKKLQLQNNSSSSEDEGKGGSKDEAENVMNKKGKKGPQKSPLDKDKMKA